MAERGVLITRPEAAGGATAVLVAGLGFLPIAAPMLGIEQLPARLPKAAGVQAVLVTSANALPALGEALHGVRLLAVGDATAARARAAGFADVSSAAGDAGDLARLVSARCEPGAGTLLLATARGEGLVLTRVLRQAGFAVQRRAVYVAVPQRTFPAAAQEALARGAAGAALFFSPASARHFVRLLRATMPVGCVRAVDALAISEAVAAPLASLPWRRIRVAAWPDQDSLMTLLADTDR